MWLGKKRLSAAVAPTIGLLLFTLTVWALHRQVAAYGYEGVFTRLRAIPATHLVLALVITIAGYITLTGYDVLALRHVGRRLPYPRVALASFVAYVVSHNVGPAFLGGSAVRYRMFTGWGLGAVEIANVIAVNVTTFWLGVLFLGGAVLATAPLRLPADVPLPGETTRALGLILLAIGCGYWAWTAREAPRVRLRGFEITLPRAGTTAAQIVLSSVDWALAASVVYVLLPPAPGLSAVRVTGIFVLAQVLGVVSHVPAGLGVFEATMVVLLTPYLPPPVTLASLIAYRLVYYVIPLAAALVLFAGYELAERYSEVLRAADVLNRLLPELVPRALAVTTFIGGVILLVSGATPAAPGRMELLDRLLPLPVMEVSHFLGSLMGVALLLLARALQQRVDAAYYFGLMLLVGGAVASLLKGVDYEEALLLTAMAIVLWRSRRYFYRRSSLVAQSFSGPWIFGIAIVLAATTLVVVIAYADVGYSRELWWEFELSAHAPRSLRALAGAFGVAAVYSLAHLLRPAHPIPPPPSSQELARAAAIASSAPRAIAHLALLGSNRLLFHEDGGFLWYGTRRRSWVAMADPVGPPDVRRELAWRFRELADQYGAAAIFYEVSAVDLPIYVDLGLTLYKLGEEARIPLDRFTLSGKAKQDLRTALNRMGREGGEFELLSPEKIPPWLDELRVISDQWLVHKNVREKRFSMGYFDRTYLARLPLAVVRMHGRLVAFANLWAGSASEEMSIDLMRYADDAPPGVIEYLFTKLILWGQERGYRWFSLGMAPLSGFERHRLAPTWNRLGGLLFRFGDHFYNFRGLRAFKEKFDPVWEPRYLASPGGLALPFALTDIAALVSGGVAGIIAR
jgi:phosphatidylglycerol lysyltransferase